MKRILLALPLVIAAFAVAPNARAEGDGEGAVEGAVKPAAPQQPSEKIVVVRGTDASGNPTLLAFGVPEPVPADSGKPVYSATRELPNVSASTWGSYRPSIRKSQQIEHLAGVVNAGYLR